MNLYQDNTFAVLIHHKIFQCYNYKKNQAD